jgi:hypothetical protein
MTVQDPETVHRIPDAEVARLVKATAAGILVVVLLFFASAPETDIDVAPPAHAATTDAPAADTSPLRGPAPEEEYEQHAYAS